MKKSNNKKTTSQNEQNQNNTGIDSEQIVLNKFKNWKSDEYARKTLLKMGYDLKRIKDVVAYIDEDKDGNRKVKLKVHVKPASPTQELNNTLIQRTIEQVKDKLYSNEYTKKILDTIIDLKDKILSKIRK